jgi:hypothetical protein
VSLPPALHSLLLNGPGPSHYDPLRYGGSAVVRAAWGRHKAELLAACKPGSRPWAFWRIQLGIPKPAGEAGELRAIKKLEISPTRRRSPTSSSAWRRSWKISAPDERAPRMPQDGRKPHGHLPSAREPVGSPVSVSARYVSRRKVGHELVTGIPGRGVIRSY